MADPSEARALLPLCSQRLAALRESLHVDEKQKRVAGIERQMGEPGFWDDSDKAQTLVQELKALKSVTDPLIAAQKSLEDAEAWLELASEEQDEAEVDNACQQIQGVAEDIDRLELIALLSGPHDREPCFLSIHTGAGGSDACEWAEMLLRMYKRFCERKGWKVEELSLSSGEEAGIKAADLRITGSFAYGYLKGEVGVHRLVRISPFSGRRETSFAAVDIVPDFQKEVAIDIEDRDLRIDTFRSSGKGGQHVNKTDSAVRITHLPTGLVVSVQNERSQHRNRDLAMKILKSRLLARQEAEREAAASARNAAKMENAWGSQIRNYVMHPYQQVKDVRTAAQVGDIQRVLDGDLDPFIDAYLKWALVQ